jgi:hypothetical protein
MHKRWKTRMPKEEMEPENETDDEND